LSAVSVVKLQEEVEHLSKAERLEAMELLWASLSTEQQDMESPEWHGKVLAARRAKVDSGKGQFLTVDLLKERLRR
jgi:putative addiction module component (TIGR02574 family)